MDNITKYCVEKQISLHTKIPRPHRASAWLSLSSALWFEEKHLGRLWDGTSHYVTREQDGFGGASFSLSSELTEHISI